MRRRANVELSRESAEGGWKLEIGEGTSNLALEPLYALAVPVRLVGKS